MNNSKLSTYMVAAVTFLIIAGTLFAIGSEQLLKKYQAISKVSSFDAGTGRRLFEKQITIDDETNSCISCHAKNITRAGSQPVLFGMVSRKVPPLARTANADLHKKAADIEKGFYKYCKEVFNRKCTTTEKGHMLTYFLSE